MPSVKMSGLSVKNKASVEQVGQTESGKFGTSTKKKAAVGTKTDLKLNR
jgi:hypothetical protein